MTPFGAPQRLVLKFGSALLVDAGTGSLREDWLASVGADIAALRSRNCAVLVVSSGAVALGRAVLGLTARRLKLEEKQAAAAAGQANLVAAWGRALAPHGIKVAQALLTPDDTERRRRWLNGRATFETLLGFGVVPVINENDTVATQELRYGDNDRLAARVAQMVGADTLVLFSDVDGLYDRDPRSHPDASHVPMIASITPEIEAMAGGINTHAGVGSGGMRTKLDAARIAAAAGCRTAITLGTRANPLAALLDGGRASWFAAATDPQTARKAWLGQNLKPKGSLTVDAGAAPWLAVLSGAIRCACLAQMAQSLRAA
ncbi:MAG: glutamate 5-kinase [Hyphomonadaceae bacterium]|nr:glutamate 5-kinase [Hyphomonadaceae bacterium]